jgi:gas vesicle protein
MGKKSAAKWGVLGAMAGAIAGVLFAPKSGKETRTDIIRGAGKAKDETGKKIDQAKQEVGKRGQQVKSTATSYADKTKRAAKRASADVKDEFSR